MPQGDAEAPGSDGGDVITAARTTSAGTNGKELSGTTAAGGCRRDTEAANAFRHPGTELRRYATEGGEGLYTGSYPHGNRMRLRPLSVSRNEKGD